MQESLYPSPRVPKRLNISDIPDQALEPLTITPPALMEAPSSSRDLLPQEGGGPEAVEAIFERESSTFSLRIPKYMNIEMQLVKCPLDREKPKCSFYSAITSGKGQPKFTIMPCK